MFGLRGRRFENLFQFAVPAESYNARDARQESGEGQAKREREMRSEEVNEVSRVRDFLFHLSSGENSGSHFSSFSPSLSACLLIPSLSTEKSREQAHAVILDVAARVWGSIRVGQGRQSASGEVEAESSLSEKEGWFLPWARVALFPETLYFSYQKPARHRELQRDQEEEEERGARRESGRQAATQRVRSP